VVDVGQVREIAAAVGTGVAVGVGVAMDVTVAVGVGEAVADGEGVAVDPGELEPPQAAALSARIAATTAMVTGFGIAPPSPSLAPPGTAQHALSSAA
jgi:hypothetical protein